MAKPSEIKKASDADHMFMGLYSIPGVGKTNLIGSLAEIFPNKVLIVKPPTDHTDSIDDEYKDLIDVWTVSGHNEMIDVLEYMRHDGGKEYEWLWIDSLTLLIDHCLDEMWDGIIAEKPHRAKHGLDQGEYYTNMVRLSRDMRHFIGRDQFNVGWTAHTMDGQLPNGKELMVPQIHVKGMWSKFCAMMSVVAYYEKVVQDNGTERRVLRVQESDGYYAKNQLRQLSKDRMVDPTMPRLLEALGKGAKPVSKVTGRKPLSAAKPAAPSARAKAKTRLARIQANRNK